MQYLSETPVWFISKAASISSGATEEALAHQAKLTKPAGSLGDLEKIAIQFAGWQGTPKPKCEKITVRVFAADHGICKHPVSAFPQQVTQQMLANFIHGGAAISVLSKQLNADFAAVNLGTVEPVADADNLINLQLAVGTQDFSKNCAMSPELCLQALKAGFDIASSSSNQLFIGGEMGIGNTTSAAAIYSAILKQDPVKLVGPGTGVDQAGIALKAKLISQALELHSAALDKPIAVLQAVGGLEIAALCGAYIRCAQQGIPVLVDGYITTAAALLASKINPSTRDWMLFSHQSAEPAHQLALQAMEAKPLLSLGMRLGEGSGAAVAVNLIRSALALHNQMATFDSAAVSEKI